MKNNSEIKVGDRVISNPDDGSGSWIIEEIYQNVPRHRGLAAKISSWSNRNVVTHCRLDELKKYVK